MSNSLKIVLIVFSIVIGNFLFYNFKPQETILSSIELNNNIKDNIKSITISKEEIKIKNISIKVNDKKELSINFDLDKNINIKTINNLIYNLDKIQINNISSTIILNDYQSNMNIDTLNIHIKNKLEDLKLDFIKEKNIKHIYNIEQFNNDIKIFYNEYNSKLSFYMLYLSMFLSSFGLIYGFIFIIKYLYLKNVFNKYIIAFKLLKK